MIAVTGAAGNVGRRVAETLLRERQDVRVFEHTRSLGDLVEAGAEVMGGELKSPADVRKLLSGVEAALLVLPDNLADPRFVANRSEMSRNIASALREHPVGHVVVVSSIGADHSGGVGQIGGLHELEQHLFALADVNVLALRSAWRMENLLAALPIVEAQKMNGGVLSGDLAIPMIAARDVAAEAAQRLLRGDFSDNSVKTLIGPEDVSMERATAALGSRLGLPHLPYVQFPPDGVVEALRGAGMSEEGASVLVESQVALNEGRLDPGPDSVRTETRLDAFLDEALRGRAG
jgi:uncharacterized protein YbjT (DUF2867 family)